MRSPPHAPPHDRPSPRRARTARPPLDSPSGLASRRASRPASHLACRARRPLDSRSQRTEERGPSKIPSLDPETGVVGAQGFAYKNYGAFDVATSFIGHMGFGLSSGIFYGLLDSMGGSSVAF
jgi:hypothetical protein